MMPLINTRNVFRCLNAKYLRNYSNSSQQPKVVPLAYELQDKTESDKALVIAHGLFGSLANWRALSKRLNEKIKQKIYIVDMRNHGNSRPYVDEMTYTDMANDLNEFIEKVVLEKDKCKYVSVLGHSMGGKAAMSLALINPKHINKLIVADIAPSVSASLENIRLILGKIQAIDLTSLDKDLFKARKQVDQMFCDLPLLEKEIGQRQYLLTRLVKNNDKIEWGFNLEGISKNIQNIMEFPEFNSKFDGQTLFMGGQLSNYITKKDEPLIAKYFSNYKLVYISKAGHVLHFDNPVETMDVIDGFVNKQ